MNRQYIPPIRSVIAELPSSKIREVANLGTGMDGVIPLWFGEPDRSTPDFINRAAAAAFAAPVLCGRSRYLVRSAGPPGAHPALGGLGLRKWRTPSRPVGVPRV